MFNLKYYSPLRFVFGIAIQISAIFKIISAKVLFSRKKTVNYKLKKDGFLIDKSFYDTSISDDIDSVVNSFDNNENLMSIVDGRFKNWSPKSSTHYLSPNEHTKKKLLKILDKTKVINKLSNHHGFEFYCRAVSIFKTEASHDSGITSTRFHRDGHPLCTYKFMIYMTNVEENSGAFSIVPSSAKKIILPTFGSYNYEREMAEEAYKKFSIFGNIGTTILFNNNSLHAGGRTKAGDRIVATYILHPKFSKKCLNTTSDVIWSPGAREYSFL